MRANRVPGARMAESRLVPHSVGTAHNQRLRCCPTARRQQRRKCRTHAATVDSQPAAKSVMVPAVESRTRSGQAAGQLHGEPMSGLISPLGAHYSHDLGAHNFVLYSSTASAVSLVLFHHHDLWCGRSSVEIPLDPLTNRTGDLWHIAVPGLHHDLLYGYRVKGANQDKMPGDATVGLKHDDTKVLLDPYATSVVSRPRWGERGNPDLDYENPEVLGLADTWPQAATPLPDPNEQEFDWQIGPLQGDRPLNLPMNELVIYEAHVRGFTANQSSEVAAPGSYLGMVERLDYLKDLGVTAIELLPVFEFNELEYYDPIPGTDLYRYNFWGYSTVAFFAPMARFSAEGAPRSAQWELKMLVREAHRRGMEVILDVVFNHTAEGNELGPHISFRGIDNRRYYMLAPEGQYYNYSGCGNTFNCNDPIVRHFILDCLRFWVQEYHIDGFRFDLASILTRAHSAWHPADWVAAMKTVKPGEENVIPAALHSGGAIRGEGGIMTDGAGVATGTPVTEPPVVQMISEDPLLRTTKLIAEAWDCDGLNQVGAFPHFGGRWAEWNGQFRDTVRQFIKGTDGDFIGAFASALMGSPELYQKSETHEGDWWGLNSGARWRGGRGPNHSINFVTAHDGFTLADSVAYIEKHNELNGENNNDGESHNLTWNCGAEGPTEDKRIYALRQRQQRNFACALLLAQGIPMILMGDEYGHTKDGNNNTYCHDSAWNYLDWRKAWDDKDGLRRFWSHLIKFRHKRPELASALQLHGEVSWHGEKLNSAPEWGSGRFIGMMIQGPHGHAIFAAWNTKHEATTVELPDRGHERGWRVVVDTGKPAPYDIMVADHWLNGPSAETAAAVASSWTKAGVYALLPWSCVVLECVPNEEIDDVRGEDRWNEVEWLGKEQAASASDTSSSESGWSSDEGGPPVDPVDPSELPERSTLTFGQGLLQQGFVGEDKKAAKAPSSKADAPPKPPATPPPGSAAERPKETMYNYQDLQKKPAEAKAGEVAGMGDGDWGNAEEEELRALSEDLLGNIATLEGLSLQEKREMLQILRENLALRNRLADN